MKSLKILGWISPFPEEIVAQILEHLEDWRVCLVVEAIHHGLPFLYPDPGEAMDNINIHAVFGASKKCLQRAGSLEGKFSLLEMAFCCRYVDEFECHELLADNIDSFKIVKYLDGRPNSNGIFEGGWYLGDLAAAEGNLEVIKYLDQQRDGACFSTRAMTAAASCGHLEVLKFLHECRTEGATTDAMDGAAKKGHLDIVRFLHENRTEGCTRAALDSAVRFGHLEVVQYLVASQPDVCNFSEMALCESSDETQIKRQMETLRFLFDSRIDGSFGTASIYLARLGDVPLLELLIERIKAAGGGWHCGSRYYEAIDSDTIVEAAKHGHLEAVKLMLERTPVRSFLEYSYWPFDQACEGGNLEIVKMLHGVKDIRCSTDAMYFAAKAGHLEIVRFLHFNRKEGCTEVAMNAAAEHGHLDVLKFLKEHRLVDCDTQGMDMAATNGHLDVVMWLHENVSCGCTTNAMDGAAANGHLEVVKFLHTQRVEGCSENAMADAAKNGHFDVLKYFHDNDVKGWSTRALDMAPISGNLDIVKFLHEFRTEGCTTAAMDNACEYGHFDILKFLHYHRSEGCTAHAMDMAAAYGHFDVMKFLHYHRSEGCTTLAMDSAARGAYRSVKFLHLHRQEGCTKQALDTAAESSAMHILRYLDKHRSEGLTEEVTRRNAPTYHLDILRYLLNKGHIKNGILITPDTEVTASMKNFLDEHFQDLPWPTYTLPPLQQNHPESPEQQNTAVREPVEPISFPFLRPRDFQNVWPDHEHAPLPPPIPVENMHVKPLPSQVDFGFLIFGSSAPPPPSTAFHHDLQPISQVPAVPPLVGLKKRKGVAAIFKKARLWFGKVDPRGFRICQRFEDARYRVWNLVVDRIGFRIWQRRKVKVGMRVWKRAGKRRVRGKQRALYINA
ncbi:hypothetical protein HDU97_008525 [Phlyctochytrium planicorne]|nr:hypothetical protein HDU97_008525 [Phlyctochytrium planicorne]